ncbi:Uncharacterized protein APZ42_033448 [Daphnia magna]|uniref:RNA-directed DNA polymerase n=1 Tax=Daphnia magna TaxID=35525 RepID=A0A164L2L6_9CRUS|nr:Uncharacterized protein APZ42_033448 [Daphnia magna]
MVKKKDGSWRFCVDYRLLNAISVKDVYPLPRIEETLSRMGNARIFCKIDLESGYWPVPLYEADKDKTAFVTPEGLYQFLVMPFGLASAPETFQRMMDFVLSGPRWSFCLVYLDDIIIYASGVKEHLSRVRQVFTALQSALQLSVCSKIKLVKCQFGASEIKALVHVISGLGIRPDPDKIHAVVNFPIPSSFNKPGEKLKCVRSFVGLCSYYRSPSPRSHLRTCLKKEALARAAILAYPGFSRPFEFHPDACDYGLGAVLLQRVDNVERPLAYSSRLLFKSESNYSITEKECLALVWAVKKFCSYIWGMETLVVTDHHALCWLLTKKDLAGCLACWILQFQEFLLRIAHRNGRLHSDANALSRYPTDAPQELDEELQCMFAALNVDLESKSALQWAQKTEWKLSFREEVMRACHHDITAGHLRLTRTLHKIRARYYWPGMGEDIRDFLQTCHEGQSRKTVYHRPAGFMEIQRIERSFERLGMDILGPFSKGGNTNIVVVMDYVTKWAETKALPRAGATEVADFLVKCFLLRHGAPHQLTTDQGRCFMMEVTQKVLQVMETNHTPTTAYRPQTNGLVEWLNHTLADLLSIRKESTGKLFSISCMGERPLSSSTELEIQIRILFPLMTKTLLNGPRKGYNEHATRFKGSKSKRFGTTKGAVGKSEKLLHRWFGPYAFVRQTTPGNYELRRGWSPKSEIVHVERIKPFVDCVSSRPPAPVPTTTGGQPEESSGDPSPQAHADNREQEPPTEVEMTIPRPTVPLVEEGGGGPRRSAKIQAARKTFTLTFALFTFLTVIRELDLTSAKEGVAYQGVIFKSEGEVAFSDSEWVVATDLMFYHLKTMMKTLREWLEESHQHVQGCLDKLSTETTSIVHALEVHASLINETLWETKAVADAVCELQTSFAQIERETWKLDQKIEGVTREMETHWIAITRVEDAFRQVESALAWPDEALNNFLVGIPMSMGRLPVLFFPPLQVQAVLKEIKVVLPPCLSLSPSIQNGDTWKVYTEAKVVVATLMPISCSAHTDDWIFQASFRKGIKHLLRNSTLPSVNQLENLVQLLPEPAEEETPSSLEKKGATANKPLLSRRAKFQGRISLMGEHLRLIEEEEKARVAMEVGGVLPAHFYHHKPHIATLCETFWRDTFEVKFKYYFTIKKNRPDKTGGGVAILVLISLQYALITLPQLATIEATAISVILDRNNTGRELTIVSLYIPDGSNCNEDDLNTLANQNTILSGDFNAHHERWHEECRTPN